MKTIEVAGPRGRRRVPAESGFPELDKLTVKLEQQREAVVADRGREKEGVAAIDQERAAQTDREARALIDGKTKPKPSAKAAELEKDLDEARTSIAVREQAVRLLESEIGALIATSAAAWSEALSERVEAELATWNAALDELDACARRLSDLLGRREWATAAAAGASSVMVRDRGLAVAGLPGRNATAYSLETVLSELRNVGAAPEARKRKTFDELVEEGNARDAERRELQQEHDRRFAERVEAVRRGEQPPSAA